MKFLRFSEHSQPIRSFDCQLFLVIAHVPCHIFLESFPKRWWCADNLSFLLLALFLSLYLWVILTWENIFGHFCSLWLLLKYFSWESFFVMLFYIPLHKRWRDIKKMSAYFPSNINIIVIFLATLPHLHHHVCENIFIDVSSNRLIQFPSATNISQRMIFFLFSSAEVNSSFRYVKVIGNERAHCDVVSRVFVKSSSGSMSRNLIWNQFYKLSFLFRVAGVAGLGHSESVRKFNAILFLYKITFH